MPIKDDTVIRQGQRRLRSLLPKARAEARRSGGSMTGESGVARSAMPYMTEKNLLAVTVYPGQLGGWHADIVLREAPIGVPKVFGTPVAEPLETREAAEERAFRLLVMVLATEAAQAVTADAAPPVFQLYDLEIRLDPGAFAAVLSNVPQAERSYGSPEAALARMEEVLAEIMPGGFSAEAFGALPREAMVRIAAVAHMAALTGVFRYPDRVAAPPRSRRH